MNGFHVTIIDSCEYLERGQSNWYAITHKGNCRFCKQRAEQDSAVWLHIDPSVDSIMMIKQ